MPGQTTTRLMLQDGSLSLIAELELVIKYFELELEYSSMRRLERLLIHGDWSRGSFFVLGR